MLYVVIVETHLVFKLLSKFSSFHDLLYNIFCKAVELFTNVFCALSTLW